MFQIARRIGVVAVLVLLAAPSFSVQAQGTGLPPASTGEYTPGKYGLAQFGSPFSPNYLSLTPLFTGCGWSLSYGDISTQNYAYPESNATYWQASTPLYNASGAKIRIDGVFPNARFFSISLYNSSYQLMGTLHDYDLATISGAKPYLGKTQPNPAVRYGQTYTAYIVFGTAPAQPAPNTLYVPPQLGALIPGLPSLQKLNLLYRVYVPGGHTASGDTPLPLVSINGVPFSSQIDSLSCQGAPAQAQQSLLYSLPLAPGQTPFSAPTSAAFTLFKDSGIPGLDAGVNADNQYMSISATQPAGYLYLIRGQAPSYTGSTKLAPGAVPNVRYWSMCQNTQTSLEVIGCVGDFQAVLDSGGYYNIVVSGGILPPLNANAGHHFNWMPFGPQSPATVIYRQQLAADGFTGASGSPTMGHYTPKMTYCTVAQFSALAAANPAAPGKVFIGCGGAAD